MELSTGVLAAYVGGQMEIQNPGEGYLYRGEIAAIEVKGDNPEEQELVAQFKWLAKGEGYPPLPTSWVKADRLDDYVARLMIYAVTNIGPSGDEIGGGDRLCLNSSIVGETVILFPPDGSKLDPATVEGLESQSQTLRKFTKLVIIRHGDYDSRRQLDETGRRDIEGLSAKLKERLNGASVLILSSTADRAWQSAEITSRVFSVPYEKHDVIWSQDSHPPNPKALLELIRSRENDAKVIMLMTHLEYSEDFPGYFAKNYLGGAQLPFHAISKGEALIIDCEGKSMEALTPQ